MSLNLGIFGGTFNPVHIGHLIIAEYVFFEFTLDKIVFVPAYIPPHKSDREITSAQHRLNMLKIALKNNKNFVYSEFEISQKTCSYTINTLKNFYSKNHNLFLIIGDEWLNEINTWYQYMKIFDYADLIVIRRTLSNPGIPEFLIKFKNQIHFSHNPLIEISSSMIRERLSQNKSVKYMLQDKVLKYIKKRKLYGTG